MSVLYLCEKPFQAADLAKVLGDSRRRESHFETVKGVVTYAIGHLLELAEMSYNSKDLFQGSLDRSSMPACILVKPRND